ncbi:hormogonium polysaccharide secretion pseudopilin HpsB [Calothrix sp. PCC 7507]|uniref:hormogonium polysaccharide secretion pseudopilin HpsB n=1 Tax=Calothrix sp. PCC 7507 TaxID=99598 RepID=UPI00029EFE22|nr:hormogonium polysaccharide secretion pseudopilin HpsB [Calothrix sp. PCC 7507]AFY32825.1 hypothetical protein Cal7507_2394 [Calothrix sp. PCC 7507]
MIHQKHLPTTQSSQSGFTIIESLVAILVTAALLAAIAPVIVLSVATRVQAKRIETATDAAKSYTDGVRSGIITAPPTTTLSGTTYTPNNYSAPSLGTLTCSANSYCSLPSADLYCIDVDGGGCTSSSARDFVIQAFRYNQVSTATADKGYQLGVRVYRASGFSSDGGNLKKAPDKQPTFTGGAGDRKAPLVEMTTEITDGVVFSDFCDRLKQPVPSPAPTPAPQSQC